MKVTDRLIHRFLHAGGRLQVRSALNPALWMCAIVTMPTLVLFAYRGNEILLIFAATPLGMAIVGFLFLLFFDRDKLQSEDFQIRKQSLELIQEKGMRVPIDSKTVERISNPELPALPPVDLGKEEMQ